MLGYTYIFFYFLLTRVVSRYMKKYDIFISKKTQKQYNAIICGLSLLLTIKSYKIVSIYSFSDIACYNIIDEDINKYRYLFFVLKFVEWFDTIMLLQKFNGNISEISNLHYYHHAIVPTMTHYGMHQPGEVFVYLTNSFAHFLMYGYYAFPEILFPIKSFITYYQYLQHTFMLFVIIYQFINSCDVTYPIINIIGYTFFFYEYMKLIFPMVCSILIKIFSNVSNINVYTSCFFIINTVYLCFKNDLVYRNSFILLTLSSIMAHQTYNKTIILIDRLFVYNIVFQGGIRLLYFYDRSILHSLFIVINFLITIFLYNYGYKQSKFCFDKDKTTAHNYHAVLHACSSLGHLSIIYLLD
jgi:hypothetical protein